MNTRHQSRTEQLANHLIPTMSYAYNKTLVVGATSGIGWALAEKIVQAGKQVIIVGRRKEKLDEFEQKYGSEKVHSVVCT
jgi:NADP-dependent 3-hydroxy acid dehydrogenase YdfG